jgi:hypothetical protein
MTTGSQWGVELRGSDQDKELWRRLLKPPFEPYIEEIAGSDAPYLALRSKAFDGLGAASEVHVRAKGLFRCLNMAMSANADADPIIPNAVVEFPAEGVPRRHHVLEAEGVVSRARLSIPELTVRDAQGNIIQSQPTASKPQEWMRAAALHSGIASAMNYLSGNPGWVELYKAYEALRDNSLAPSAISANELRRFTHTANVEERHRENKYDPPTKPMTLWEARGLMMTWLANAIDEVLGANP